MDSKLVLADLENQNDPPFSVPFVRKKTSAELTCLSHLGSQDYDIFQFFFKIISFNCLTDLARLFSVLKVCDFEHRCMILRLLHPQPPLSYKFKLELKEVDLHMFKKERNQVPY